jgi:hypothetical protein
MRAAPDCRSTQTRTSTSHPPSNETQSTGSCAPARGRRPVQTQDHIAAPHGWRRAAPGPRPGRAPAPSRPAAVAPHVTTRPQPTTTGLRKGGCPVSATGPSTTRCSKDVTTHQHLPGARLGRPCPAPTCSGQPLPGERRFSAPLRN